MSALIILQLAMLRPGAVQEIDPCIGLVRGILTFIRGHVHARHDGNTIGHHMHTVLAFLVHRDCLKWADSALSVLLALVHCATAIF